MRTFKKIAILGSTAAVLAFPGAAAAETPSASAQCKAERAQMGAATFAATYGTNANKSNAFGKCVSKRAKATAAAEKGAKTNASKECKAEQAADPAGFAARYGTGKKGANAHGKCVSSKAKTQAERTVAAQVKADVNAARTCKAARAKDKAAFAAKWGSGRNAFGKCVSATAKSKA